MRTASISAAVLALATTARAQDAHHWTQQYGTRPTLLGGAVTAEPGDASAIYYNPAGLALLTQSSVSATGNAYGWQRVTLRDVAGTEQDIHDADGLAVPGLLAGVRVQEGLGTRHGLALALLTRASFDTRLSSRTSYPVDVLSTSPGAETFIGETTRDARLQEFWAGIGYGLRIKEWLAVGVSQFLSLRTQENGLVLKAQAVGTTGNPGVTTDVERHSLDHLGLRWKLGVAADLGWLHLGATLTTPDVGLWSDGRYERTQVSSGVDIDFDGIPDRVDWSQSDGSASAHHRDPGSAGFGATVDLKPVRLHGAIEWFAPIGAYALVRPDGPATGAGAPATRSAATAQARAVVNWSLAAEWALGESLVAYASFRSDYATVDDTTDANFTVGTYDLWHATLGGTWKDAKSELTLGLAVSWGGDHATQPVDYSAPTEASLLLGGTSEARVRYLAIWLVVGFTWHV